MVIAMPTDARSRFYIYLAGFLFFLVLGVLLVSWSERRRLADYRARAQWRQLQRLDRTGDLQQALKLGLQLDSARPPVGIRMMRRRWQRALELYRRATAHRQKERSISDAGKTHNPLDRQLFELEKTGQQLRRARLAPAIAWRIENLLGAGYLLRALLILERGGELKTCQALLHQAIDCFKKAIQLVDRVPGRTGLTNIPRWNLELLITSGQMARMALADNRPGSRYDLRRNLTIMLPGSSGYLTGEPPDNRVLK